MLCHSFWALFIRCTSLQIQHFVTSFKFGDPDFLPGIDILVTGRHLPVFFHIFTVHAQKLLFPSHRWKFWPRHSATPISWKRAKVGDETTFSGVFFNVQIENLAYFYIQFIWLNVLEHFSHVALRPVIIFTKFEVCQMVERLGHSVFLLL